MRKIFGADRRPSNNAAEEVGLFRETEKPVCFLYGLSGLDGNTAMDSSGSKFLAQIIEREVSREHLHVLANPGKFLCSINPEMMMSINAVSRHFAGSRRAIRC